LALSMLLLRLLALLAAIYSVILLCTEVSTVCLIMLVIRRGLTIPTSSGHAVLCRRSVVLREVGPMHPPWQQWVSGLLLLLLMLVLVLLYLLVRSDCHATASFAITSILLFLLLNLMHRLLVRIDGRKLRVVAGTV